MMSNESTKRQTNKRNRGRRVGKDTVQSTPKTDRSDIRNKRTCGIREEDFSNDPSWYSKNQEMMKAAASLAFSNPLGHSLDLTNDPATACNNVAGIMAFNYVPTFGNMSVATAAARNIYSYVRHQNSGHANYDAPDLMMYIMAADQAFAAIAHLIRAYGVARNYNQRNRYTPEALLQAMGFNAKDVIGNLANFWFQINNLIARASVIWIPNTMPITARHFWMNSNLYSDAESAKSQTYLYVPRGFYCYNPTLSEVGGGLEFKLWKDSEIDLRTVDSAVAYVNALIEPLLEDEDMGIMSGDILKAYGKETIYQINEIPADYTIMPVYNKEVLSQMHNAIAVSLAPGKIVQNPTGDISMDGFTTNSKNMWNMINLPNKALFDFDQAECPSPEQVMVASRLTELGLLKSAVESGSTNSYYITFSNVGSEYVYNFEIVTLMPTGITSTTFYSCTTTAVTNNNVFLNWYTQFDWAPLIYVRDKFPTNGEPFVPQYVVGDVNNFTVLDSSSLAKMHLTAIYSELGVPAM